MTEGFAEMDLLLLLSIL